MMPVKPVFCFYFTILAFAIGAGAGVDSRQLIDAVSHHPAQPRSGEAVKIIARIPTGASNVTLQYQVVEPGKYIDLKDVAYRTNWTSLLMIEGGNSADAKAGEGFYSVELPASLQIHRRLVRYRVVAKDAKGQTLTAPDVDGPQLNFAYFVYDGVPGWRAAIDPKSPEPQKSQVVTYDPRVMGSVQAYHFVSKSSSVANATWREQSGGKEYKYTGTMVIDGTVYDHIRFRARGGVWRYAMGKNMWKFEFKPGHHLEARDDYGRPYKEKWSKLNLRACIQQGDYGHRGEQGMFESVGFRLFSLAGVPAPRTHWIQLRIIDAPEENPTNQYKGDFWGLYLAIENEDGHFLKAHGLPDGNLFKMEGGTGTLSNPGNGAVTNSSDLNRFLATYNGNPSPQWWRTNLDLPRYYSYRSIIECIHHYDVQDGKNYDYYLNPKTRQWTVIPWDIDLTWADNMYGGGGEPFRDRVLSRPAFRLEYQNRLREIRDLLFNPEQAGQLIDECAAIIADPAGGPSLADADRAKWDYHPVMARGGKAGQGLFYQITPSKNFRGMVQLMKNYVKTRAAWIDANLLADAKVPAAATVTYTGAADYPGGRLSFHCSEFRGTSAFAAMQWRAGEAVDPNELAKPRSRRPVLPNRTAEGGGGEAEPHEITPVWESEESTAFNPDLTLPPGVLKAAHTYRVRVRMKDATGRWSHWSAPVQFKVSAGAS